MTVSDILFLLTELGSLDHESKVVFTAKQASLAENDAIGGTVTAIATRGMLCNVPADTQQHQLQLPPLSMLSPP